LAWSLWGLGVALSFVAVVFLALSWSTPPPEGTFGFRGFAAIFAVTFGTVGALIASRHPANPIGWIALSSSLLSGVQELAFEYGIWAMLDGHARRALGEIAAWVPTWIWLPATFGAMVILLLFPDGHTLSRGWRWVMVLGAAGTSIASLGFALAPGPLENFRSVDNPFGIGSNDAMVAVGLGGETLYGFSFILSAVSVALRFRRSRGDERQQMKWLVASGIFLSLTLVSSFVGQIVGSEPAADVPLVLALVVIAGFASLPVAMAFAILKYRLYDIDLVISKTLVIGLLAAFITVVYVAIVVGVGAVIGSRANAVLSAIAAAVVALAFQPARRWARRLADHLVYGERATPYEVLSRFSDRLAESYSIEDVLPRMSRVLAEGVGATAVTILLGTGGDRHPVASYPTGSQPKDARTFEVRHQGEPLGAIAVSMPAGEPLGPVQEKLATDVATQAGLVLRNARLVEELQESRRRIVAAQDERARALERNIHDGAQQQLVALAVKLSLAERLMKGDPAKAEAMLAEAKAATGEALEDLRDLARGIYPPLLAEEGLASALRAQARKSAVHVTVESDSIGRYPREIESAVYFCALEALQNIAKHAGSAQATIRLRPGNGDLTFEIADDGPGFDPGQTSGTGLQGMADRLAALGGTLEVRTSPGTGTTLVGSVPIRKAVG
jgi:signal transduction histidine kinase